ncbi:MAG: phosphopantetheine-binding protein [Bryobacteraceae bacterium]
MAESGVQGLSDADVLERFSRIVAKSLRVDAAKVTPDASLTTDLGAESLDLIEITMETESEFNIWLPEKNILETASDVFGQDVLYKDGQLSEAGKELLKKRMPESDQHLFSGDVSVEVLTTYFLKVHSWVRMIQGLAAHTPLTCPTCGAPLAPIAGFRMKCNACGYEVALRSGEELNREWVKEYYEKEYLPAQGTPASTADAAPSA